MALSWRPERNHRLEYLYSESRRLLFSGGYLLEKRAIIACYFGIFLVSAFLSATCWAGIHHIKEAGTVPWPKRLPIPGEDSKEPISGNGWNARIYQSIVILIFTIIPVISLFHFNKTVWKHGIIWSDVSDAAINAVPVKCMFFSADGCDRAKLEAMQPREAGHRYWLAENVHDPKKWEIKRAGNGPPVWFTDPRFKFGEHDLSEECREKSSKGRGVEWFHPGSVIAMWAFTAFAIGSVAVLLFHLFRSDKNLDREGMR